MSSSQTDTGGRTTGPHLIIVTGRPAAGKTTLARWLAQELQIPVISKDSIREVLFERLGWQDRAWAQLLGRATIDLMFYFAEVQLEMGRSLILDNAFDPALSTPRFRALVDRHAAQAIQIICDSDRDTLFERFKTRAGSGVRHPGHRDDDALDQLRHHLAQDISPRMELGGPVIEVDTTDMSQVDYSVLCQVKRILQMDWRRANGRRATRKALKLPYALVQPGTMPRLRSSKRADW